MIILLFVLLFLAPSGGGVIGLGLLFWLIMLAVLAFGFWWPRGQAYYGYYVPYHIAFWICIALLGWRVFGWPIGN